MIDFNLGGMKRSYTVSFVRSESGKKVWYAHMVGFPYIPVMSERGTFGTKKQAMQIAADSMGLPLKEYMGLKII